MAAVIVCGSHPWHLLGAAAILARVRPTRAQLRPAKRGQNMYNLVG
jgi:hypothetical protein